MKSFIPKQPKHARERVEAKLDERLVRKLERYCAYLESDRDYIITQALELVFRKDKGFSAWLLTAAVSSPVPSPDESIPVARLNPAARRISAATETARPSALGHAE
jgi:hypothetical protein